MDVFGIAFLMMAAFVIGLASQLVYRVHFELEWLAAGVAAFLGGYLASEHLGALGAWGPEVDGLFVLPALIGAGLLAALVGLISRATDQVAT
jgi:hypothetical protein